MKKKQNNPIKFMWEQGDMFEFKIFQDFQEASKSNSNVFWEPDEQQMLKRTTAFLILVNLKLDPLKMARNSQGSKAGGELELHL